MLLRFVRCTNNSSNSNNHSNNDSNNNNKQTVSTFVKMCCPKNDMAVSETATKSEVPLLLGANLSLFSQH